MSHPHQSPPWEWYGSPGHFIGHPWCKFHLCTYVGSYIVSTIGEYYPENTNPTDLDLFPGFDIGCGRKYETMVFPAHYGNRCDNHPCCCGQMIPDSWTELAMQGYNDRLSATKGHMALCEEWSSRGQLAQKQPQTQE